MARGIVITAATLLALMLGAREATARAPTCASVGDVVALASRRATDARARAEDARRIERRAHAAVLRAQRGEPGTHVERGLNRTYQGEWSDGRRSGLGRAQIVLGPNVGEYYAGEFQNNNPHGLGVEGGSQSEGHWTYAGEMRDGLRHGLGVFQIEGGTSYSGDYRAGAMLGLVDLRWPNGDRYLGEIAGQELEGLGALHTSGGVLEGRWRQSQLIEPCTH